jgi:acetyl esterase/lipase
VTTSTRAPRAIRPRSRLVGQLLYWLTKSLAPDLRSMEALQTAIRKDRDNGPARPSKRLLKKLEFFEERRDGRPVFHVARRGRGVSRLHLLYLHGGAFVLDLQDIQWKLVDGLLTQLDAEMAIPIYPLGPEATWRETMTCITSIYLDLVESVGAENVVVAGDSAGGGLALLLAQAMRDDGKAKPAALVLFSPVLDLSVSGADQPALERRDAAISISLIRNAGSLWAPDLPPDDPRVSPLFADQEGLPPTLVFTGDREVLESDARRLKVRNPAVDHRSYAEMPHVFPVGGLREGRHAYRETAAFIEAHIQHGA